MLYIDNQNHTDPRLNLAIEEHILRNLAIEEPIVLFYINEPAVIIGRNQNTLEEIDPDYVDENNIHLVRRLSGGGAVYHDLGNLNFSFITNGSRDLHNFAKFTGPVIRTLQALGVDAELRGKSDIFAGGKKVSGNAQYSSKGRMFSHGTLLFDTDLTALLKAINPRRAKIESRAVQSIRNFVTNIRELLPQDMGIGEFKTAVLNNIFNHNPIAEYKLTTADWDTIRQIAADRYDSWEWTIGRSPKFNTQKSGRLPIGKVDVRTQVIDGRIQSVKVYGDFGGDEEIGRFESHLVGVKYERAAIAAALRDVDLNTYFGELTLDAFLEVLY